MDPPKGPHGPRLPNGHPRQVELPLAERMGHFHRQDESYVEEEWVEEVESLEVQEVPGCSSRLHSSRITSPELTDLSSEDEASRQSNQEDQPSEATEGRLSEVGSEEAYAPVYRHKARGLHSGNYRTGRDGTPKDRDPFSRTFQRLLLEISAEHHRALARVKAELEVPLACATVPENRLVDERSARLSSATNSTARDFNHWVESPTDASARTPRLQVQVKETQFEISDTASEAKRKRRRKESSWKNHFSRLSLSEMPASIRNSKRLSPFDFVSEQRSDHKQAGPLRGHLLKLLGWRGGHHRDHEYRENWCQKLVKHQLFDLSCALGIVMNCVLQGWAANTAVTAAMRGEHPDEVSPMFQAMTVSFTVWFLLELLIRLRAMDVSLCFSRLDDNWMWNIFDACVVCSDVAHTVAELNSANTIRENASTSENFTVVRMLRVFRITRALRVVRLVRFFRELRMMMYSVLRSGCSLLWSLVLLSFTIYAFAVYFMQISAFQLHQLQADPREDIDMGLLKSGFGNLARAEYSLYMAVSGGISWGELCRLFIDIHEVHGVIFCVFIFFTSFAVLNIITGIFVESAMSSARSNQEELVQEQMYSTAGLLEEMKKIFHSADRNKDGAISLDEFEEHLDTKEVRAYLDALGVGLEKARGLFDLLDLDSSGEITAEEFAFGCLRLKGWAKSIDLATLMNHNRRMAEQFRRFFQWCEGQFRQRHEFEARLTDFFGLSAQMDTTLTSEAARTPPKTPRSGLATAPC